MSRPLRILVTFAGGHGHLNPMLPLADALRQAGHSVALAGQDDVVERLRGFDRVFPYRSGAGRSASESTGALVQPDLTHEFEVIGSHFVSRLGPKNAARVGHAITEWRPDVVVSDEMDFGGMLAAEKARLPRVVVKVIASGALTRQPFVEGPLRALRLDLGLDPGAAMSSLDGDVTVSPFPPSLRDPAFPLPAGALSTRPSETTDRAQDPAATWFASGREPGRVYFTLGTIFNTESGDLFRRALAGLSRLPARVLATVGPNVDPSSLSVAAPTLRIERFLPQADVLPHADLVVCHGGSGSVVGALSHGVPLLALPMGADQQLNADRVTALGAGLTLDPITSSSDDIGAAASALLASESYRRQARALQTEIGSMPPVTTAVGPIEGLARP